MDVDHNKVIAFWRAEVGHAQDHLEAMNRRLLRAIEAAHPSLPLDDDPLLADPTPLDAP